MGSKFEIIESEIAGLNQLELAELWEWFARFDAEAWDRQISSDVADGKLDALAERALAAHRAGKTTPL
jgi:hypothetical protein